MFDGRTPLQKVIHKENHKRKSYVGALTCGGSFLGLTFSD